MAPFAQLAEYAVTGDALVLALQRRVIFIP